MSITSATVVSGVNAVDFANNLNASLLAGNQPFGEPFLFGEQGLIGQLMVQGVPNAAASSSLSPSNNPKNTAINTVGAGVLTGAAIVGSVVSRGGVQSANFSDATDTATNIIAALLPSTPAGTSWYVDILNTTTFQQTVTAGAGVTFSGTKLQGGSIVIAPNTFVRVLTTYTGAGAVSMLAEFVDDLGVDNLNATTDPGVGNDNTQGYGPGSEWFNVTLGREWTCLSAATGAAVWAFGGASYNTGGYNPANEATQFGAGLATFLEEGNISRQMVAAGVQPATTANDNVLAVYSIPANSFDISGRGITVTAAGAFGATANNKTVKLIFNPSSAVVGSAIVGGTTICTTGVTAQNAGGWQLQGTVFKYGAAASNTQICVNNGAVGTTHFGVTAPALTTAVESGAILVAVTGNAATVATDILFNWLEVNAMN